MFADSRCFLPGNIHSAGDTALGYDLANAQLVGLDYDAFIAKGGQTPDVILVRSPLPTH